MPFPYLSHAFPILNPYTIHTLLIHYPDTIDAVPCTLSDLCQILTSLCDATLFVVRQNYTPKILIRKIDENNRVNPITNPAIVFNGVKTRGFLRNYYGYGYQYGYGNKKKLKAKKIRKEVMS